MNKRTLNVRARYSFKMDKTYESYMTTFSSVKDLATTVH